MSAHLKMTALLCAAPVLGQALLMALALRFGVDILDHSVLGVTVVWVACTCSLAFALVTFGGAFRHLVSDWLIWISLILHGALMIMFFAGLHAAAGVICIAEICDNDTSIAKSEGYLHAPLGVAVALPDQSACNFKHNAIGPDADVQDGCIALDTSLKTGLYFSAVTFSTVGYGDFQPIPRMRLLAALESVIGFLFFGLLAGAAIDTISRSKTASAAIPRDDARKVAKDMNQALVALRARLGDAEK